MTPVGQI